MKPTMVKYIPLFSFFIFSVSGCVHHHRRPLQPLMSISEFSRSFKKIAHQHEMSLIEDKDFDLLSNLKNLQKVIKQEMQKTKYNYNILYDDYTQGCLPLGSTCFIAHWVKEKVRQLKQHIESDLDLIFGQFAKHNAVC